MQNNSDAFASIHLKGKDENNSTWDNFYSFNLVFLSVYDEKKIIKIGNLINVNYSQISFISLTNTILLYLLIYTKH